MKRNAAPTTPEVRYTHVDRVVFPEAGLTKGNVLDYYERIADRLLPHLRDRPMTIERFPQGLSRPDAPHFWQKNTPDYYPKWIPRVALPSEDGRKVNYLLVNDRATLMYLVNQGTLTFHIWFSTIKDVDRPTFVLFDIDPHQSTFANAISVAKTLRDVLKSDKIEAFIKTSGKSGLHVMTPWKRGTYADVQKWGRGIAARVVEAIPEIATTERSIEKRKGRVYLDVEQNAKGKHAVAPYVIRATPTATVSTPLDWKEVTPRLDPKKFTIKTIWKRLEGKKEPMAALTS